MIPEALKYPFKGEKSTNNIVIGSLLVFGSIFILPAFILMGYFARVINNSVKGEVAPEFKDYKGLFVDGIKLTAVYIAYFVLIFVLMLPIVFLGSINEYLGLVAFWFYVPVFLLFYVGHPALSYCYGKNLSFREAFDIRNVVKKVISWRYAKIFLLFIGLQIGFSIAQIMLAVTIIGLLIIPTTLFIELVIYAKLLSELGG